MITDKTHEAGWCELTDEQIFLAYFDCSRNFQLHVPHRLWLRSV